MPARDPTRRAFVLTLPVLPAALRTEAAEPPPADKPPTLSATGEAQLKALLAARGGQFSEGQKADLRRLLAAVEKTSQTLRAFPVPDQAEPAFLFRVYRKGR